MTIHIDGTTSEDTLQGDGEAAPFYLFDDEKQSNIAGPFETRNEAQTELHKLVPVKQDAAEAASLQTYLMEHHADVRPIHPDGLFAWTEAALRKEDTQLILHVEAAARKMKSRDTYVHMILMSVLNTLRKK